MVNTEMCRFCLDPMDDGRAAYPFDQQMCILEMGSGTKVTVGDALKYIELDVLIPVKKEKDDNSEAEEKEDEEEEAIEEQTDHPELPKSLCQECLDKLQSIYEFKYRVLENRDYLKTYLDELAEAKLAEERAARQAIAEELDIDLNNLDSLPDKLVLKQAKERPKKPRKQRDPSEPKRKRRMPDKSVIIAEDSQVDTAVYVRKIITTPEASPDQKSSSKRKSKHVIIEDIAVAEKPKPPPKYEKVVKKKEPLCDENNPNESNNSEIDADTLIDQTISTKKAPPRLDEPIFEDDDDFEPQQRPKRSRK
ncbi:hypothetical protein PVAND_012183 [Polypedilum vanderplanki]|uniref:ZAD domain-containing protein n=1 Tax=Polypedilum vanderplanki TaxID=319348 RepID=A0A9J6CMM0_POLVA|nr:hypothetical protein PVAND_012183 [Polypedilum vanderplanki]